MRRSMVPGLVFVVTAFTGCGTEVPTEESAGQCSDAYGAEVCTWAVVQANSVIEVGATIPMASIENAPAEAPMTWPPTMTASAYLPESATEQNGLSHLTMYWEPMGHTPMTFLVPHFDFHFYLIPPSERLEIDCNDLSKPSALAQGYSLPDEQLPEELVALTGVETLIGVCVPEMGMHSLVTVEMQSEDPFDGTMVIGYYQGEPIFVEPMISRSKLQERTSFDLAVPTIPGLAGEQPTVFRAEYDGDQDSYRFTFSEFSSGS